MTLKLYGPTGEVDFEPPEGLTEDCKREVNDYLAGCGARGFGPQLETVEAIIARHAPHAPHDVFNYQLLSRLQADCEYYLGHGQRAAKHLWAGDEAAQIAKMRELYEGFDEKPEWLTLEDIARYEAAMVTDSATNEETPP
jgi:hypothetical protein